MEEWHDQIPNAPDLGDASTIERKPPYSIIVSTDILLLTGNAYANHLTGLDADGWFGAYFVVVVGLQYKALDIELTSEYEMVTEFLQLHKSCDKYGHTKYAL